jgi:hypothetical protein
VRRKRRGGRPRIIEDPVSDTFSLERKWKEFIEAEAERLGFSSRSAMYREICSWWFQTREEWLKQWEEKQKGDEG